MNLKLGFDLVKTAIRNWIDDYAPSMGAALSYYTVFSVAPLLIITIAIAAIVFDQQTAQQQLLDQIRGLIGDQGAHAIEAMLQNAQKPKQGALASILGIVTLVIGATFRSESTFSVVMSLPTSSLRCVPVAVVTTPPITVATAAIGIRTVVCSFSCTVTGCVAGR